MRLLLRLLTINLLLIVTANAFAQSKITVRGVVKDSDNGLEKSGVTISSGNPLRAIAATDSKGTFTVTVDAGTELVFTHTGFKTVRNKVFQSETSLVITMEVQSNTMKELVVQGFRQKTRETSTGSSTIINGRALQDVPVSNVIELLQGKIAGLNIQNNTGSPGAMGTINLRGISNISISADGFLTPTSPLFIVDGVPVDVNTNFEYGFQSGGSGISPISLIPPEDIEQMETLKDAAATSQYGSRAAYGVIIITTKRGKSKVPIVQYSTSVFVKTPPKLKIIVGGKDERLFRINTILNYDTSLASAYALINQTPFLSDSLNPYYNNSTNWQDYFYRTTVNHQHNLSIRGGDDKFNYKTNLNYYQENGIVENTGFKRYSLSMNALYAPAKNFRMTVNLSGTLGTKQNGSGVGLIQTGIASSAQTSSLLPPPSLFSENNSALATVNVKNNNKTSNISSSFDIQYQPMDGIRFGNTLSYNYSSGTTDKTTPGYLNNGQTSPYSYNDNRTTLFNRSIISFDKSIKGNHNLSGYVFNEINSSQFRANSIQLYGTANDQITGPLGYNYAASTGGTQTNLSDTRQHGYGASFSYNYKLKYVVDFSYRLDGLSTNGPSQGYSRNPSVSARWNFSKEKWFDKADWLSFGSVKGSWGRNIRPTGSIFDVYGRYIVGLPYNNNPTVTIDYGTVPNDKFLPETQTQLSGGLEMGLWNGGLEASFETYYRAIDNQVMSVALSNITGFSSLQTNSVSVVNYGFEWSTRVRIFKPSNNKVGWTISLNGALNRDILAKLPGNLRQMPIAINDGSETPVIYRIGRNSLSNLLYHTQAIYNSTSDVPVNIATGRRQELGAGTGFYFQGGDPRWTDINGDYIIDGNDLLPIGNPVPKVTGGITSELRYKNFQLNTNFSYTLFRDVLNSSLSQIFKNFSNPAALNPLVPSNSYNFWFPSAGDKSKGTINARYPNPYDFRRAGTLQPFRTNQTLFLEDGSYWKINNTVLSYNFDKKILSKLRMTSCRVTLTANNLFTFSKYSGPDPELVSALGRDNSGGYPSARSYAIGFNVQF